MLKEKESYKIEAHKIEEIKKEVSKLDIILTNLKVDIK